MAKAAPERRVNIPTHKHCKVCGVSVPAKRDYCSKECEEKATKAEARTRRMSRIWILVFIMLMLMLVVFSLTAR